MTCLSLSFYRERSDYPVTYPRLLVVIEPMADPRPPDSIQRTDPCHIANNKLYWNHLGIFKNIDACLIPRHSDLIGMGWNLSNGIFKSSKFGNLFHKSIHMPKDLKLR